MTEKSFHQQEESYTELKRKMKEITDLNAAMNRDYLQAKKKIRTLIFERNLLLDSIHRLGNNNSSLHISDDSESEDNSAFSDTDDEIDVVTPSLKSTSNNNSSKILKKLASKPASMNNDTNHTTARRSKTAPVVTKTRRVQPVERDANGNPILPQQIGVLKVLNLGKIVTDRPNFHNERYIFPVGYTVSRTYPSMIHPDSNTIITSTIQDNGDGPQFVVTAADMPDEPIIANSATGAWTVVVRKTNEIRHRDHSNSASGPDYYGFKHPTIANLIQDLPGAKDLPHYVWQNFEEMEPKAAKGVMAAAEKKRGNLEQMGNANRKIPSKQDGFDMYDSSKEQVMYL